MIQSRNRSLPKKNKGAVENIPHGPLKMQKDRGSGM
jgi:hypothetical protein